ncbi:kinase-like protein [Backusella circina FSU 941]|nr:kinase-like protein [Backusella circina FSU 941]
MNILFTRATDSSASEASSLWSSSKESEQQQQVSSSEDYSDQNVSSIQYKPKISVQHDEAILKQRQIKWILVSLIEKLCSIYGESNEETRKIFMKTCQTLSALGFIDSEFIDEVAGVRTTYYNMFEQLLYTAMDSVRGRYKIMTFMERQNMMNEQFQSFTDNLDGKPTKPAEYNYKSSADDLISETFQNSRYYNDFLQTTILGRGAFSSVWKAQNRLDDIEYAIKKVKLSEGDPYAVIFQEIKTWASLEHPYVIRYYSSWLEYASSRDTSAEKEEKKFEREQQDELESLDGGSCGNESASSDDMKSADFSNNSNSGTKKNNLVLYIQMQLCPSTLYEYIRCRNQHSYIDHERNIEIFRKILEGAAYIHQQGLVHRDLKPSNIFLNRNDDHHAVCLCKEESWSPKIGDFGFAAEAMDFLPGTDPKTNIKSIVGTRQYAAPEQLISPNQPFDEKTDIYSLGIILFELYYLYTHLTERAKAIEQLKRGIFPDHFDQFPFIKDIVSQMMHSDPSQRPSACELLNHEIYTKPQEEEEMEFMMDQYYKMKEEKENLERRMLEMEQEMEEMEMMEEYNHPIAATEFVMA